MFILSSFKSNDFVCAHSKRFTDAFFVSADSKEFPGVDQRQSVASVNVVESVTTYESVASAKRLAGFAVPLTSAVIGRSFMNMGNSH